MKKRFLIFVFALLIFPAGIEAADTPEVSVCTWKDGHKGALSISIDDSCLSCAFSLLANGFRGTYFAVTPPSRKLRFFNYPLLSLLYRLGNEIGAHTVRHPDHAVSCSFLEDDIVENLRDISEKIGLSKKGIISMAWPGGYVQHKELAGQYFLSVRGYNINQFEDPLPDDFMNLKSFNSQEHPPFPPADFRGLLDEAERYGKWAILVFHRDCQDGGAISYARHKDLWVAPIGEIIKYILQRQRLRISGPRETAQQLSFTVSRNRMPISEKRNFEEAFGPKDKVTLKISIDNQRGIGKLCIDKRRAAYKVKDKDGRRYILLNIALYAEKERLVEISYAKPKKR